MAAAGYAANPPAPPPPPKHAPAPAVIPAAAPVAVSVGSSGPVSAGVPAAAVPAPTPIPAAAPGLTSNARISFQNKEFDFGRVPQGQVLKMEFVFTNTGSSTLEVQDVRPGCGCTTAGVWSRTVEPGKTGSIPIQFSTANFGGRVSKPVTVTCNDPTQPNVSLHINGEIWRAIDIQPNFVYFNAADPETNETRIARIINNMPDDLKITDVTSTNRMFAVELKEVRPGKEFELRVTTVPPLEGINPQTSITAKTSSTNVPELKLTAMAMVAPPVVATPLTVMLPAGPLSGASQYVVTVRNNRPATPIAITNATVNLTNVTVKVTEAQPGQVFNVLLGFPQGYELGPGQMGRLTIATTHPKVPSLNVNVVQFAGNATPRPNRASALPPPQAANAHPPAAAPQAAQGQAPGGTVNK